MKKKGIKRALSLVLTLVMLLGMLPTTVFAADYELTVGETLELEGNWGFSHNWESENEAVAAITKGSSGDTATIKAIGVGTTTITHEYKSMRGNTRVETWEITVVADDSGSDGDGGGTDGGNTGDGGDTGNTGDSGEKSAAVYLYTMVPGVSSSSSASADDIWNGMGIGTITGYGDPSDYAMGTVISADPAELAGNVVFSETDYVFPDITDKVTGKTYKYAAYGTENASKAGYYTVQWTQLVVADGANAGNNNVNRPTVNSGIKTFHLDGQVTLNEQTEEEKPEEPTYVTVSFALKDAGNTHFVVQSGYTVRVVSGYSESDLTVPSFAATKIADGIEYTFDGWYLDEDCTQKAAFDGTVGQNTTYYSRYVKQEYMVSYNANGGTGAPESQVKIAGEDLTLSTDEPTREGYVFSGWNDRANGAGTGYEPGAAYTKDDDVTLYAQWIADPGTLVVKKTFVGLGKDDLPGAFQIIVDGNDGITTRSLSAAVASEDGLTYIWELSVAPGQYTITEGYGNVEGYDLLSQSTTSTVAEVISNKTAEAALRNIYQIQTFTVTWMGEDDGNEETSELLEIDENVAYGTTPSYDEELPVKAADGETTYVFAGWTDDGGTLYTVEMLPPVTEDVTYTATFAVQHTVSYEDGVDGEAFESQSYTAAEGAFTPNFDGVPARTGYSFTGWDPDWAAVVTKSVTYTATWTPKGDTPYAVEHYQQKEDGSGFDLAETETLFGTTGTETAEPTVKGYTGFVFDEDVKGTVLSDTIAADGNTVLKLYYIRTYTVIWKDSDTAGTVLETDTEVKHGTTPTYDGKIPTRLADGHYTYTFDGWKDEAGNVYPKGTELPAVTGNVTYTVNYAAESVHHIGTVKVVLNGAYNSTTHEISGGTLTDITTILESDDVTLHLKGEDGAWYDLKRTAAGVYENQELPDGDYQIYVREDGTNTLISKQLLTIDNANRTRYLYYYSVTYELNGDAGGPEPSTTYHYDSTSVQVSTAVPTKAGHTFAGWKDQDGNAYAASTNVAKVTLTESIGQEYVLTAQWDAAVKVNVTVVVDHNADSGGYDEDISEPLIIVLQQGSDGNYTDVYGSTRMIPVGTWYQNTVENVTTYEAGPLYTELSKVYEYSAHASLTGYRHDKTVVTQPEEGGDTYGVTIYLQYDPAGFDLVFNVAIDTSGLGAGDTRLIPKSVDVRVTYWNGTTWVPITEHEHSSMQVEINGITQNGDTTLWQGTGTVHVWAFSDDTDKTPYLYRVEVSAIDLGLGDNGYLSLDSSGQTTPQDTKFSSTGKYVFPAGAYTAVVNVSDDCDNNLAGDLLGAHVYDVAGALTQHGTILATVSIHPYTLKLDANGGSLPEGVSGTITNRFTVPDLTPYTPSHESSTFDGWYTGNGVGGDWGERAEPGDYIKNFEDVTTTAGSEVTLYAKWKAPITVSGTISVAGTYLLDGTTHVIPAADRLKSAKVVLQELNASGNAITKQEAPVTFTYGENGVGKAIYTFYNVPDTGNYRIYVLAQNYTETYQNEPDSLTKVTEYTSYGKDSYMALTDGDATAVVNVYLEFTPVKFDLKYEVDASRIGAGYRPAQVDVLVVCDDGTAENHWEWTAISQMVKNGVETGDTLTLGADGKYDLNGADPSYPVWQFDPNGYAYDYAIRLQNYASGDEMIPFGDSALFTVEYENFATYVEGVGQDVTPVATLIPKEFNITYVLNAGSDTVTGLDNAPTKHTWSHVTDGIPTTLTREGYRFAGWTADVAGAYADGMILAGTASHVTLTAQWAKQKKVTFVVENGTWADDTATDIVYNVELVDDKADITALIPTGMKAAYGFKEGGSWGDGAADLTANKDGKVILSGSADATYTFTFERVYVDVIYHVANPDAGSSETALKSATDTLPYGESICVDPAGGKWVHEETTYSETVTLKREADITLADPTRDDHVFTGWLRTDGSGEVTYLYTAQWEKDESGNAVPDIYEKDVIFQIQNGTWDGENSEDITVTVVLYKDGKWAVDGSASIEELIPEISESRPDEGFLSTAPAPFWSPALPGDYMVSGTATETFVYRHYTTVTYPDADTDANGDKEPDVLTKPILPSLYIKVDPNGGIWKDTSAVSFEKIDGACTLADPTRSDHVFRGWTCELNGDEYEQGILVYIFTAQWIHVNDLLYPASVTVRLDDVPAEVSALHDGATGLSVRLSSGQGEYIPLTKTEVGVYTALLHAGTYYVYRVEGEHLHKVGNYQLVVTADGGSMVIDHYSVTYVLGENGAFKAGEDPGVGIYFLGTGVATTMAVPVKDGFDFVGWKYDGDGEIYEGDEVFTPTGGIARASKLEAQWEIAVRAKVNVELTIHHHVSPEATGTIGVNPLAGQSDLDLNLTYRPTGSSVDYWEQGKTYTDVDWYEHGTTGSSTGTWHEEEYEKLTTTLAYGYEVTSFADLSLESEYSANILLDDYVLITREVSSEADDAGNVTYTVKAVLQYWPDLFDLDYTVIADDSIPDELIPVAVDLKVVAWDANTADAWAPVSRHVESSVDVHFDEYVDAGDAVCRKGNGSYGVPVYKVNLGEDGDAVDSGTYPYYYRVAVVGFTLPDGTELTASGDDWIQFYSNTNVAQSSEISTFAIPLNYADEAYWAKVEITGGQTTAEMALPGVYGEPDNAESSRKTSYDQVGSITVTVYMNAYDIHFDANGGTLTDREGETISKLEDQFRVPELRGYVPTRTGGYSFESWYWDEDNDGVIDEGETAIARGTPLASDIALIAKWKEPLTITGNITVEGTYTQDDQLVAVPRMDRATKVAVVLQTYDGTRTENLKMVEVDVTWPTVSAGVGTASYAFTGLSVLPEGSNYQILAYATNHNAAYRNEESVGTAFSVEDNDAVFKTNPSATYVDADLKFVPDSYAQIVRVDASAIGEGYRPDNVQTVILGWQQGSYNEYVVISQHSVYPYGMNILLGNGGLGEETQDVWKQHWDNALYDYKVQLTQVDGVDYTGNDPRFTVSDSNVTCWNTATETAPGPLILTLTPNKFDVTFDMNAVGMADEKREDLHTWSFDTAVDYAPTRSGYVFMGWYDNPACTGTALTKIDGSVCADTTLYADWEVDVLVDPTVDPSPTQPGDGVPDIYQCIVTFEIVGGTWGVNGGSDPIRHVYTLKTKVNGAWTACTPALGSRLPTNMQPVDSGAAPEAGHWNPAATSETTVTGAITYTYTYSYAITVIVEHGTATIGERQFTNTTVTLPIVFDDNAQTVIAFSPADRYTLESVTVEGTASDTGTIPDEFTHTVKHDGNHVVHVVYGVDANGDDVLDAYQKKVIFVVENGTWAGQSGAVRLEYYVTLNDDSGKASATGTANIQSIVPTPVANENFKAKGWDVEPEITVSGTSEVTYTYRFVAPRMVTYPYTILHYKQQPNGQYAHADTAAGSVQVELNVAGTDFEAGKIPVIHLTELDYMTYGAHYALNDRHEGWKVTGTPAYGQPLTFSLYYKLDSHTLSYDLNGAGSDADYDPVTLLCGSTATVKDAPVRKGYIFEGWLAASASSSNSAKLAGTVYHPGNTFTLEADLVLVAQWTLKTGLSYTVEYWEVDAAGTEVKKIDSEEGDHKSYGDKVMAESLKKDIFGYTYYGASDVELVIGENESENLIKLYYTRYEKPVTFRIENGKWADDTSDAYTIYVPLDKDGTGTFTAPTGMIADSGYRGGSWDVEPEGTVSGTDAVTYTYTYVAITYYDAPYEIRHYKQKSDGSYQLVAADTERGTRRLVLTLDETAFEAGQDLAVIATAKNYGAPYSEETEHAGRKASGTLERSGTLVLSLYYKLASYEVTYDLNGGFAADGIAEGYYDTSAHLHGSTYTVKTGPIKTGHVFAGWRVKPGTDTYLAGDTFAVTGNVELEAQWNVQTGLSYTVNHWEKGADPANLLRSQVVDGQSYGTVIYSESLKALDITGFAYDRCEKESITVDTDSSKNVINLYYTRKTYQYAVEYYYDDVKDESKTASANAPYETKITEYEVSETTQHNGASYVLNHKDGLPLTVGANESLNVIRVYYVSSGKGDPQIPDKYEKPVTFQIQNGKWADGTSGAYTIYVPLYKDGKLDAEGVGTFTVPTGMKANSGYRGGSWSGSKPTGEVRGTEPVVYRYVFTRSGGGGTPSGPDDSDKGSVVLTKVDANDRSTTLSGVTFELFKSNGTSLGVYTTDAQGKITVNNLDSGSYYWMEIRPKEGYQIDYTKQTFNATNGQTAALTVTNTRAEVPEVFSGDHYGYIIGYADGLVHPMDNITRAEVATIFFRLLSDEIRSEYMTKENSFADVPADAWYCTAVSTMASMGIVNGSPDGNFYPLKSITRAEFAAIAARFEEHGNTTNASFSDIYGHWAQKEINIAANNGWVLGYVDGTFKPNQPIVRAEAMAMVNRVLQRIPEKVDDLLPNMITWPDNRNKETWYYLTIQEATNSHTYSRKVSGYEYWIELRKVRDWAELEQ